MRKQTRLLSSLLDLKLERKQTKSAAIDEQVRCLQSQGKRKSVKCAPIWLDDNETQIFETFTVVGKKKSCIDRTLITKSLSSHFTFANLISDQSILNLLLENFKLCRVNKGDYLMKQNDKASSFFILHQGELIVEIDGSPRKKLESGQGFGELALLYSSPRSASIKAAKASFLWFIDRSTFRKAISSLMRKNYEETRNFIEEISFFKELTSAQKDRIASVAIIQKFKHDSVICREGELASSMFIVKSGCLVSSHQPIPGNQGLPRTLREGHTFGEQRFLGVNKNWAETVSVKEDAEVIALGIQDVEKVLGRSIPLIILRNKVRELLVHNQSFRHLSQHFIDLTLDCFKITSMKPNEKLSSSDCIFLVLEGSYKLSCGTPENSKLIDHHMPENRRLYGSIMEQGTKNVHQVTLETPAKIAFTTKQAILKAFQISYQEAVEKSLFIQQTAQQHRNQLSNQRDQSKKYTLADYKVVNKLGEGQFGTVYLVTDPTKDKLYAMKCISKAQTVRGRLQKYLINEKRVLEEMSENCPFCINFFRSYKDENYVYFLMEYVKGLELFDVIRIINILTVDQARFYTAVLLQALEEMHSRNIIYRDLKPENVMVSQDGYLKLIDMGTCKKLGDKGASQKTFTIIGTPSYMAPDVISGKGYSFAADLWSLGVVLFEFLAGYVPFGEDIEDPYEIYKEILKKPLKFPHYMKEESVNSFISQLLLKSADTRFCGSYSALKRHCFLKPISWSELLAKSTKPAFLIPKQKLPVLEPKMSKLKDLSSILPKTKMPANRKDYDAKWDECF